MADETLIKPKVTIEIPVGQASVESATVTLAVDRPPVAYIKFHPGTQDNEVIEAVASEVSDRMGEAQELLFEDRDEADTTLSISAEGGDVGTLEFKGLLASPNFGVSTNNIAYSASIVHESALLNSLDMSIYRLSENLWKSDAEGSEGLKSTELGERITAVIDRLVSSGVEFEGGNKDFRRQQVVLAIDEKINSVGLPILKTILSNTEVDMESWQAMLKQDTGFSNQVNDYILGVLHQSAGGFFNNMDSLAEGFQLIFVPDIDDVGKFIARADAINNEGAEEIDLLSGISLSAGSAVIQPITNVISLNVNSADWKVGSSDDRVASVYAYPDTYVGGGRVLTVPPPPYSGYIPILDKIENPVANISIAEYEESRRTLMKAGLKATEAYEDILKDWCRNIYCQAALAQATASCQVPLDLNLKPGVRCKVTTPNGNLFTGFLRQVTHTINGGRTGPNAFTNLDFSLVEAGGFELPYKDG